MIDRYLFANSLSLFLGRHLRAARDPPSLFGAEAFSGRPIRCCTTLASRNDSRLSTRRRGVGGGGIVCSIDRCSIHTAIGLAVILQFDFAVDSVCRRGLCLFYMRVAGHRCHLLQRRVFVTRKGRRVSFVCGVRGR